jgi:hypothetical protein
MADDFRALKRELARRERGRGKRYPGEMKRRVVTWALGRRKEGATWPAVADELGLGLDTVRRWCLAALKSDAPTRALVPVRVVARPSPARPATLVSVSGWRIDGLSVSEAAEMLRSLG